jgi:hypothetical protein
VRALVGATALAVIVAGAPVGASASPGETPLDHARLAAQAISFSGVVDVTWRDGRSMRSRQLTVKAAQGALLFGGPTPLMALDRARLVRDEAAWDVLWPAAFGRLSRPSTGDKYEERVSVGPELLGVQTVKIDFREHDRLRERLYVDHDSGLLLRREQFDERARLQRSMSFRALRVGGGASVVPRPVSMVTDAPRPVTATQVHAPYTAPDALDEGYRRTGVFRQHDVVQVVYSDGLYDLSVFEQRGRLGPGAVPVGGRPVDVGDGRGWHYTWAGGQVVLWQSGRTVYTAVGDGPFDDVVAAVQAVPGPPGPSVLHRFRQACRTFVGTLRRKA